MADAEKALLPLREKGWDEGYLRPAGRTKTLFRLSEP